MDPQTGAASPDQLIGQTVGNYLVTQKLGEGGMGSVYLAEHPTIGKKVALKVLHAEFSSNKEVADRFFTEAKAVNAIGHPNIVDIVDYGMIETAGGRDQLVYFIMEYLSGATLSHVVRSQSPLPPERALSIAMQVADALAASHKTNIVHRDLKPDNIILIQRGREADFVKLLDFGIAKLTGNDGMSSHKTRTGLVLGTPAYMSPEQCEGRATVDHRTDIYALGVVLYEMLTGRVPFIGEGYGEILVQHLTQQPIPPSQYRMMSPHIEQVVLKALEKRPEMRYPTMDEFMRAMSDPVGYVEANGGLQGFAAKQLMPSNAPIGPMKLTPAPMTPLPGLLSPVPGTLSAPTPTTLGAAAGQVATPKSKTPFIIAGAFTLVAAAAGVFFVIKGKKDSAQAVADKGSDSVKVDTGSGSAAVVTPPTPNTGSGSAAVATPPPNTGSGSAGSAAVEPPNTGSGSAAVATPNTGSGSAVTPPNTGSAAAPAPKVLHVTADQEAEIWINGKKTDKKTPADLTFLSTDKEAKITLSRAGYVDFVKTVTLDADKVMLDATLTKKQVKVGPGTGRGSGSGKKNTHGGDDLERPE